MTPSRPLTHDLFKNFAEQYQININEIIIYNLVEGIFFAKLYCEQNGVEIQIDSRTSDAIALAVRFECPIYTYEFVLSQAGIILEDEEQNDDEADLIDEEYDMEDFNADPVERLTLSELELKLKESIENEDYESASKIRDEIKRRADN